MTMDLRKIIADTAYQICMFNLKLTYGRLGPEGKNNCSVERDIGHQAGLVVEEATEYRNARSMVGLLDGAIDMLVTEVWYEVLEAAYHVNGVSIADAIVEVENRLRTQPIQMKCIEPLIFLARLGVDIEYGIDMVIEDNNTKFITEVHECAKTIDHYRTKLGIECEARPVDAYQREWGVFRLPDLKMLKPLAYSKRQMEGKGMRLENAIPPHMRDWLVWPESFLMGPTDIRIQPVRSIK